MKKLFTLLFLCMLALPAFAQFPNPSFENWGTRTNIYAIDFQANRIVPLDTFDTNELDGWFSSNSVTGHKDISQKSLVTESTDAIYGTRAVRFYTDSIYAKTTISTLGLVLPGFLVNGNFNFSLQDVLAGGGIITPAVLKGAGTPDTNRYYKFRAAVKYAPSLRDSMLLWAVLRKGDTIVAQAKIQLGTAFNTYTWVEAEFNYERCLKPDTLVTMLSSSTPDFGTLIRSGQSNITTGSVLFVDSVALIKTFPTGYKYKPVAFADEINVNRNGSATFGVLANDQDCNGSTLTIVSNTLPKRGTLVKNGNNFTYTPNTNVVGTDTFFYTVSNGTDTSRTFVKLSIFTFTGVEELVANSLSIFPNPTATLLNVRLESSENYRLVVVNTNGQVVREVAVAPSSQASVDVADLANGIYRVQAIGTSFRKVGSFVVSH
jgi:hypothetical protein